MTYPQHTKICGLEVTKLNPVHWLVTIWKPIWGTTVTINENFIRQAIKEKATLVVRVRTAPDVYVQEIIKPIKWKKESKVIKKVFLHANNPMVMYEREVIGEEMSLTEAVANVK